MLHKKQKKCRLLGRKDKFYEHVWGNTVAVDDNAIMVYINRLRGKIEDDRQNPAYILTIRGLGYRFVP